MRLFLLNDIACQIQCKSSLVANLTEFFPGGRGTKLMVSGR